MKKSFISTLTFLCLGSSYSQAATEDFSGMGKGGALRVIASSSAEKDKNEEVQAHKSHIIQDVTGAGTGGAVGLASYSLCKMGIGYFFPSEKAVASDVSSHVCQAVGMGVGYLVTKGLDRFYNTIDTQAEQAVSRAEKEGRVQQALDKAADRALTKFAPTVDKRLNILEIKLPTIDEKVSILEGRVDADGYTLQNSYSGAFLTADWNNKWRVPALTESLRKDETDMHAHADQRWLLRRVGGKKELP